MAATEATAKPPASARSQLTRTLTWGFWAYFWSGIATLNARLVSVGLADLRGALGLGFDEASWIPTALNMATMFSGVFVVFLNACTVLAEFCCPPPDLRGHICLVALCAEAIGRCWHW